MSDSPPVPETRFLTRDEAITLIATWCRRLVALDQVVELRALKVRRGHGRPHTEAGFYDHEHLPELVRAAFELTPLASGVYLTLNPLKPELLARRCNRIDWAQEGELTKDTDVLARRWLLIDIDPVRDPHISASETEREQAHSVATTIHTFLSGRGWPDPIVADSGNGYHLFYRIDLPADDSGLVRRVLESLAAQFDTPAAVVDRSVFNPARIVKFPGTLARKGDSLPDRPHRRAKFLQMPEADIPVTHEQLEELAGPTPMSAPVPPTVAPPPNPHNFSSRLCVDQWLTARGIPFRVKPQPDAQGRTVYVLGACPFDARHADPDASIMQAAEGKLSAHCFHNGCVGRGWQAFKQAIGPPEPEHYDPPLSPKSRRTPRPPTRSPGHTSSREAEPRRPEGTPDAKAEIRPTIVIDPSVTTVAETMAAITEQFLAAGHCYRRAGQLVRIHDQTIHPVLTVPELTGLLQAYAEVQIGSETQAEYKPLPTAYAATWLHHPEELTRLPEITLFTENPVYTTDNRMSPPGYDAASGIYYTGPGVEARDTTDQLDRLLRDFCFRSPADRTNYVGMLLTALLMPRFIGSKPAVLFAGNQPGLGKSILAQILAILREGHPVGTATYNPNDEEFEKRLGAIVRRGVTTIIVDNAKGNGRAARIDSACLERSITDPILSFRLLGSSTEIRAENSHLFCLTANSPEVSRDLVTRSVLVDLYHEGDPTSRVFTIADPEDYAQEHRWELLGELIGLVERWRAGGSPLAATPSRFNKKGWARTIGGILAFHGFADFLANAATAAVLDPTRREFADLVSLLAEQPQETWTAGELAELTSRHGLFAEEFREASPRARAIRLGILAGRYVGVRFSLSRTQWAIFHRCEDRKGTVYRLLLPGTAAGDSV